MPKFLSFPLARAQEVLKILFETAGDPAEKAYIRNIMSRARGNATNGLATEGRLLLNEADGKWLRERSSSLSSSGKYVDRTPSKRDKIVKTTRPDDGAPTTIRTMGERAFDDIARDSALRQEQAAAKSGRKLNRTRFATKRTIAEDIF